MNNKVIDFMKKKKEVDDKKVVIVTSDISNELLMVVSKYFEAYPKECVFASFALLENVSHTYQQYFDNDIDFEYLIKKLNERIPI